MLKNEIEIGGIYEVRWHDGSFTEVKILGPRRMTVGYGSRSGKLSTRTQYNATNLKTGRMVVIKSAAKLRRKVG